MRRTSLTILGCAALLAATLPARTRAQTPASTAPADDPRPRFRGSFSFAGGDGERAALQTAIEHAVDGMNFITQPIARGRLRGKNPVYSTLAFDFPTGQVAVTFDGRATIRSRDDGVPGSGTTLTGETVQVLQRFNQGALVQLLVAGNGTRRNDFSVSADGHTLTMRVTVTSEQLPHPLHYTLTYRH
jgi:hypothetical protein